MARRQLPSALLLVAAFTAVGAVLRLIIAHESLFADELSTYWIVTTHSLPDVVRVVHSDAEITPPLFFVLSRLTTAFSHGAEWLRAPSIIAGLALIPIAYGLGRRTIGPRPALLGALIVAIAPFSVYYSTEARAYGVMLALSTASTLALLLAIDTRRRRWWVAYALCSAGAMYSHYTCAFLLATQAVWALVVHRDAWRPVLAANAGAALLFAPWITGLLADFDSPTTVILSQLSPFTAGSVRFALERWAFGYPGAIPLAPRDFPGIVPILLLFAGLLLGLAGVVTAKRRPAAGEALRSRTTFLVLLALSLPVGEVVFSLLGTNLMGTRNIAASWPALVLVYAAVLWAAPSRLRPLAVGLGLAFFVIGAVRLPTDDFKRPDVRSAAARIDREAPPGSVVIDGTGAVSPGPTTSLDAALQGRYRVVRVLAPAERDHPFNVYDQIVPFPAAIKQAVALARGRRIWLVTSSLLRPGARDPRDPFERRAALRAGRFPPPYRLVEQHTYSGVSPTRLRVYAPR